MNERRVDLNLINVFYAIMVERSVTKAAQRLSMSQPAVSTALRRLRYLFGDELFIKVPGGLEPTDNALHLWPSIKEGLEQIKSVSIPSAFDPLQSTQVFNIAVADTLSSRLVPEISECFLRQAPQAKLHFHSHSHPRSVEGLEKGILDCAIGIFLDLPAGQFSETLMQDKYVCVMRHNHPLSRLEMTPEAFAAAKHVLLKQPGRDLGVVDCWLAENTCIRDISLTVSNALDGLEIVRRTDLMIALPRSFVASLENTDGIIVRSIPVRQESVSYKLAWHERSKHTGSAIWLRKLIKSVAARYSDDVHASPASPVPAEKRIQQLGRQLA